MKLWLTRDNDGKENALVWSGEMPRQVGGCCWIGAECVGTAFDADCKPGTCQRLYTEGEMAECLRFVHWFSDESGEMGDRARALLEKLDG